MHNMKKTGLLLLMATFGLHNIVMATDGAQNPESVTASEILGIQDDTEIIILYTNDVHSHIANTKTVELTDGTKEEVPALRLSNISQMVKDLREEGKEVFLVDAGDEVQGTTYGAINEGDTVIKLMNATGYQIATPGNHEFDYGLFRFFEIIDQADYPYITSTFHSLDGEDPFEASMVFDAGDKKIAFIGVTTPEAITSSTPTYFQDSNGEFIYVIDGISNPQDMYDTVQDTVNNLIDQADYIIGLGHVGVGLDEQRNHISSYDLIENTTGIDAFIDGHSHSTMPFEMVTDKEDHLVLLTQTGSYLDSVGVMEISYDGTITSHLVNEYDNFDAEVAEIESEAITYLKEVLGQKIAELPFKLYTNNPDKSDQRLIRAQELNLGDFAADALYWYFNEKLDMSCDLAIQNGGNIRAELNAGDITMNDIKSVEPFGNMACMIEATGQQLLDALEMGATVTGEYSFQWDAPAENGGFLHVAGMRYTIDTSISSSVSLDDSGMFKSVDGEYRVKDVEIYNRETQSYEPLDIDKIYRIGGDDYKLQNSGNGLSMFSKCSLVVDYVDQYSDVLAAYVKSFSSDNGISVMSTENSPLSKLDNYQIDYENPLGAGRITIIE